MNSVIRYGLSFDKAFANKIQGAKESDIMQLQVLTSKSLSSQHIDFLLTMGVNCDGLIVYPDIRTNIYDVIDFYRENVLTGEEQIPNNHSLLGVGGGAIDHLIINEMTNSIHEINDIRVGKLWANTLEKLLFRSVFARYKHLELKQSIIFVNSDPTSRSLNHCNLILERHELSKLWFSDEVVLCAESNDKALLVAKYEGLGWWIRASAKSELVIHDIIKSFCDVMELQLRPMA